MQDRIFRRGTLSGEERREVVIKRNATEADQAQAMRINAGDDACCGFHAELLRIGAVTVSPVRDSIDKGVPLMRMA